MILLIISVALVVVIASALYGLFSSSIQLAVDLRRSIENTPLELCSGKARCTVCGTNFLEVKNLADGKCGGCGRRLCKDCSTEDWFCPVCHKGRFENHIPKQEGGPSSGSKQNKIYQTKQQSRNNDLEEMRSGEFEHNRRSYLLEYKAGKAVFPEYGVEIADELTNNNKGVNEVETSIKSWEDNWSFIKKKNVDEILKPLAMYVPSANQSLSARVGEVDIDDLSDLSDYSDIDVNYLVK